MKKTVSILMALCLVFLCSCTKAENNAVAKPKEQQNTTYTGLPALQEIKMEVPMVSGLSNEKIEHAYGIAKNSKPHQISVDSEKYFEEKNAKAITYDTKTKSKVMYLTFDCGYDNGNTEKILDVLKEKNVKSAFFCTIDILKKCPEVVARIIKEGHIVGNHSTTHPSFAEISVEQMTKEIEECDNYLRKNFGYTSPYFRFPKGEYTETALKVVGELGYTSVFWSLSYADWDTENQKGADYALETVSSRFHSGAVILLHAVSSDNASAMAQIIDTARKEGYEFKTLDDLEYTSSN